MQSCNETVTDKGRPDSVAPFLCAVDSSGNHNYYLSPGRCCIRTLENIRSYQRQGCRTSENRKGEVLYCEQDSRLNRIPNTSR